MSMDDNQQPGLRLISRCSQSLSALTLRKPTLSLAALSLFSLVAAGLLVSTAFFPIEPLRSKLTKSAPLKEHQTRSSVDESSEVLVVVEAENPQIIKEILDDLGSRIARQPDSFGNLIYRIEPGEIHTKGLQYLSPDQLERGLVEVKKYLPVIRGRWDRVQLDAVIHRLSQQIESSIARDQDPEQLLKHADILASSLVHYVSDGTDYRTPWPDLVAIDPRMHQSSGNIVYLMNEAGNMGWLKLNLATEDAQTQQADASLQLLREIVERVQHDHTNSAIGMTGSPVLAQEANFRLQRNLLLVAVLCVVGVSLWLGIGFRGIRYPALVLLMLLNVALWTSSCVIVVLGELTALRAASVMIGMGLGLVWSVTLLFRYLSLRQAGQAFQQALTNATAFLGPKMLMISLACFCAVVTPSPQIATWGIIVGGGLLFWIFAIIVLLPPLLFRMAPEQTLLPTWLPGKPLHSLAQRAPRSLLITSVLLLLGISSGLFRSGEARPEIGHSFDTDVVRPGSTEAAKLQQRLFEETSHPQPYAVSLAESPQQADELRRKFEAVPSVSHVEELGSRFPAFHSERTPQLIDAFATQLQWIPQQPPQMPAPSPTSFGRAVDNLLQSLEGQSQTSAVEAFRQLDEFLDRFSALNGANQEQFLRAFQYRFHDSLLGQFQDLSAASNSDPIRFADFPQELVSQLVTPDGKWLVKIFPRVQSGDAETLTNFVEDIRVIDPAVGGSLVHNYEQSQQTQAGLVQAVAYALTAMALMILCGFLQRRFQFMVLLPALILSGILGVVGNHWEYSVSPLWVVLPLSVIVYALTSYLDFRNCRDASLVMLPVLLAASGLLGVLGWMQLPLTAAILMIVPVVLCLAAFHALQLIRDFRDSDTTTQSSGSSANTIFFSSLIVMLAGGMLLIPTLHDLFSAGIVLLSGMGICLLLSLITLPALLAVLAPREVKGTLEKRKQSTANSPRKKLSKAA